MGWGSPFYGFAGAQSSAAGNITPVLPSPLVDDDLMLLICETATESVSAPSGWSELTGSPVAATATRLTIFYRRFVTGDSAPTVTFTGNHISGRIVSLCGVKNSGDPVNAQASTTQAVASSGTITWPAVTSTVKNTLVLNIGSHPTDTTATQTASAANATLSDRTLFFQGRIDQGVTTGDGGGVFVISGPHHLVGSSGQTTATLTTGATLALLTVAFLPVDSITDLDGAAARVLLPGDRSSYVSGGYGRYGRAVHVSDDGKRVLVGASHFSETSSLRNGYRYYGGSTWDTERRIGKDYQAWAISSLRGVNGLATADGWSYLGGPFGANGNGAVYCMSDDNSVALAVQTQGTSGQQSFGGRVACSPDGDSLVAGGLWYASGYYSSDAHVLRKTGKYSDVVKAWTNCRSYYKLDETSGTAADDLKDNNEGTFVNSPTLNTAVGPILGGDEKGQKCVSLSAASSQYIRCASARILSGGTGEILMWVRTTATVAQTIYCERSTSSGSNVLRLSMTSGGYLKTEYANDSGVTNTITMTSYPINDGQWHVVNWRNGANWTKTCFVDGGSLYADVTVAETFTNTNVESWIGGDPRDGNYFTGDIAHVALFTGGTAGYNSQDAPWSTYACMQLRLFPTRKRLVTTASYNYDSTYVAISDDGSIVATWGYNTTTTTGSITVFSGANWATETTLTPSDAVSGDDFGAYQSAEESSINLLFMSGDGSVIVAGAPGKDSYKGAVYVWSGTNWGTQTKLVSAYAVAGQRTGYALDCTPDCSVIAVGSPLNSSTHGSYVSVFSGTNWGTETQLPSPIDIYTTGFEYSNLGIRVAINDAGTKVAATAKMGGWGFVRNSSLYSEMDEARGCVYVWGYSAGWSLTETLSPTAQKSGSSPAYILGSLSMSGDGRCIVIGAAQSYDDPISRNRQSGKAWVMGFLPGGTIPANAVVKGTQPGTTSAEAVPTTDVAGSAWAKNSVADVGDSDVTLVASTSEAASVCTAEEFPLASLAGATFSFEVSLTGGGKMDIGVLDAENPDSTVGSDAFAGVAGFFGARLDLTNNRVGDVIDGTVVSYATYDPESPSGTFTIDAVMAY